MKTVIITNAGISSRFNQGIPKDQAVLKAIYHKDDPTCTLLYRMLDKCGFADRIVLVGGYRFDDLKAYVDTCLDEDMRARIEMVYNPHFEDLGSGYSLYLGIIEALKLMKQAGTVREKTKGQDTLEAEKEHVSSAEGEDSDEIIFIEGDLDFDRASFDKIIGSGKNVLTYNSTPIMANKAVVLYRDASERYRYAFNSSHGLLHIDEPFSCILNSGQVWKFTDPGLLGEANDIFAREDIAGTNLSIIQKYLDRVDPEAVQLIGFEKWTNCNTREDYDMIMQSSC